MTNPTTAEKFINWITGIPISLFDAASSVFTGAGANSTIGLVPNPGNSGTTNRYLNEAGTWAQPSFSQLSGSLAYSSLTGVGISTIASGSLTGATITISSIPQFYSYLVLEVTGWSQDTNTCRLIVRAGTGGVDSTAGDYVGIVITGTTTTNFTTNALASMTDAATQVIAQTGAATVGIFGYQAGPTKRFNSRVLSNTAEDQCMGSLLLITAIDTITIGTSAAGNFDAGTYALYGIA